MGTSRKVAAASELLARALLATIFILSGLNKLVDQAGTIAMIDAGHLPMPIVAYWAGTVVELCGALLLLVGFKARWAALALAVFCIVTGAAFHNNFADQAQIVQFLKNLAIAGGLLHVTARGVGRWSIDGSRVG